MIAAQFQIQDRHDEAIVCLDAAEPALERLDDVGLSTVSFVGRAWIAHARGDLTTAVEFAEKGIALAANGTNVLTNTAAVAMHGWVIARVGRLDEACELLSGCVRTAEEIGMPLAIPLLWVATADAFIWSGRLDEIVEMLDRYVPRFAALGSGWNAVLPITLLGEALSRRGDHDRAERLLCDAIDGATRMGFPMSRARALSALARIRREVSKAEDLVHEGLEVRRASGSTVEIPASLEALADISARRGSDDEAARLLAASLAERERMGCPVPPVDLAAHEALVERLRGTAAWDEGLALSIDEAVAYATRARGARGRPATGWESLTPTELDVVRWAAEGMTNPEIGTKLFMSRATVKAHLSRVYAKLGISSRAELAAEAARRGA